MRLLTYLSAMLLLISGCGQQNNTVPEDVAIDSNSVNLTAAQFKNAAITTGKVEHKQIYTTLKLNGKIDVPPQNMVSISVPLGGYLKSTNLLPGMHIKKGQVIGTVEDQQYIQLQQDYLTAKARIKYLENEYKRQKDLNQSQASSDKVFQQSEADYRSQLVLISSLKEKLSIAGINVNNISETKIIKSVNIYAPISGYVSKVNVNIGKYVTPTEVLFELVDPSDIHLALKVFERDLDKLYVGQELFAYTNNEREKKHKCTILMIGKDLSDDRNTDVHCHFENYNKRLIPGTYMNAEVEVKNATATVLPTEAIVQYEGKNFVFISKGKRTFEMIEVNTGENTNGYTAIIFASNSNMESQDFVLNGAYSLLMMMKNKEE
ncbi:MAG: efflux RND transporter periplasmic adaptor subunit [Candidatus Pedobacter colombiensis]|uniref:Efflux RND transporter periplasmic adaptor subunit n=1 Tax=Candidatus Pedobacter colombiensis TaxID=3121371 RepID=A0AAJ5W616_9SPHI|nr:efflux RND transporter periplasmic adaptor subunit [Pedobacter sp.]WEK17800.1 MAG: efflux RND transporter periplasmic adaptor subunit [Pedobacter sp.]